MIRRAPSSRSWRPHQLTLVVSALLATLGCAVAAEQNWKGRKFAAPAELGRELIGTSPPEWNVTDWINSENISLRSLRGKVVLVRWWTAPGCPYCKASADALNEWATRYRARGLVVVGLYHHKADDPLSRKHVVSEAKKLGFDFPIAIDPDWRTLRNWWLDRETRGWTSASFLIDRSGIIRHVHGGGAYFKGEPGYAAFESAIEKALADPS